MGNGERFSMSWRHHIIVALCLGEYLWHWSSHVMVPGDQQHLWLSRIPGRLVRQVIRVSGGIKLIQKYPPFPTTTRKGAVARVFHGLLAQPPRQAISLSQWLPYGLWTPIRTPNCHINPQGISGLPRVCCRWIICTCTYLGQSYKGDTSHFLHPTDSPTTAGCVQQSRCWWVACVCGCEPQKWHDGVQSVWGYTYNIVFVRIWTRP